MTHNQDAVQQSISLLDNLSLAELKAVQQALREKMAKAEQREIANAAAQIQAIARNVGKSVQEIMGMSKTMKSVKYRSPDGAHEWSGHGRQPRWVTEWLKADSTHTLQQLAV